MKEAIPPATESDLSERILWLILLRWIAAGGLLIFISAVRFVLGLDVPFLQLYAGNLLLAALNGVYLFQFRRLEKLRDSSRKALGATALANTQISLDLVLLTYLILFSGGIQSPFVFFYTFHMVIAGILLSNRSAYLQATFASVLFGLAIAAERAGVLPYDRLLGAGLPGLDSYLWSRLARYAVLIATLYTTVYLSTTIVNRLRRRDRELEDLNQRLLENDRIKSRYVMTVSHDIRGSLAAMQSSLRVVLGGYTEPLPPNAREMIERAEMRSEQLLSFVRDLLDLSRMRAAAEMVREKLSLSELASNTLMHAQSLLSDKNLTATIEDRAGDSSLCANREAIEHVLENLLDNAIRYTPPGGKVLFTIDDEPSSGSLRLGITDTGIGIAEEDVPRIFEDFYRAGNARERESNGTGLGLSIVKHIVEAHGGRIDVESRLGRGTTFTIIVPRQKRGNGGPQT
jgi:signal transduction histidine kinase